MTSGASSWHHRPNPARWINTHVFTEGIISDGDVKRFVAWRLISTGVTEACHHVATAEDIFVRRRRDEELSTGLKLDLHLQSRRKSRRRPSREVNSGTRLAALSPVGLTTPPLNRDGARVRPVWHLRRLWSSRSYAAGPARSQRCLRLRRQRHLAFQGEPKTPWTSLFINKVIEKWKINSIFSKWRWVDMTVLCLHSMHSCNCRRPTLLFLQYTRSILCHLGIDFHNYC